MVYEHALLFNMSYYLLILELCELQQFCLLAFSEKINLFFQIQIPLPYHTLQLTKNVGVWSNPLIHLNQLQLKSRLVLGIGFSGKI